MCAVVETQTASSDQPEGEGTHVPVTHPHVTAFAQGVTVQRGDRAMGNSLSRRSIKRVRT